MSSKPGTKQALTPKLRFPGFEGEWTYESLEKVAYFINERVSTDTLKPNNYISTENILPEFEGLKRTEKKPESGTATKFIPGDILVSNIRPYLKKIWYSDSEGGTSNDIIVIRNRAKIDDLYLSHIIKNSDFIGYVMKSAKGLKMPRGDVALMRQYPVAYCDLVEQQCIADCLSSLDAIIQAQTNKLAALRQHKTGLMQRLLPGEDKTVPELRFPEFEGAGEWKERKLERLAKRGSGHTPSKATPEYYNGGIKWVSLADSKNLDAGFIYETEVELSEEGLRNSSAVLNPAGTVLLSRDAGVGKVAVMKTPMAVSQHFITWICDPEQLHNWFLYYCLYVKKPIFERVAVGNTIKTIGLPFFVDMEISVPSLPEQIHIADCLSSIDNLINIQGQKVAELKTFKRGLMQGLFPAGDGE